MTNTQTPSVNPAALKAMLHDGAEIALLDVREAGQFGESHLLFATPLPYSRLELDIFRLLPRRGARIVVCDDGRLGVAERAASRMRELGYGDVAVLASGTRAWAAAGHALFRGVNVPSKTLGELVEHACHTPRISAQELARMQAANEDFVILDGRPFAEYNKMNIPGGICCPNAELPYRVATMVRSPSTKIVVNCAGRTRSIIGAQTLINFGVPNPVVALENGTQGWYLADYKLEKQATRRYPEAIDPATLPAARDAARKLMQRFGAGEVSAAEVARWLRDPARTTYLCDVRTAEEFATDAIPGTLHTPGGQLIQATDQWVAVRHARVALIDGEAVRAPVVASWLAQLGYDVSVLAKGTRSGLQVPPVPSSALPALPQISAPDLKKALESKRATAFDLNGSMAYRRAHVPGSRWSMRTRIVDDVRRVTGRLALIADDIGVAQLAALELAAAGKSDVVLLTGGLADWTKAGYPLESSPEKPADAECIDHLFFVHDRHAGNREAMRQYLAWETGLLAQLDAQDRAEFHVAGPLAPGFPSSPARPTP
jgi:rhodanese-related sulfurtransferase